MLWGDLTSNNNNKVPLICIHGGPGATSAYMKPYSLLSVDYGMPVIIYDQVGCGKSTRLRDKKGDTEFWGFDLFAAELANLISSLGITTFDVLGHSWGGLVATRYASRQPKGLRKLIVANAAAVMAQKVESEQVQMENLPPPFSDAAKEAARTGNKDTPEYKAAYEEWNRHYMSRLDPWSEEMKECWAAFEEDDTVSSAAGAMTDVDVRPELRKITAETVPGGMLVMNSRYDQATDELVYPFFLLPTARVKWVRLAEAGHLAILDETEEVVKATGEFLMMEVNVEGT
jgi:L-proline amide hydrolase